MRKSKSNPAKYTRNYRKISQRHMTGYDDSGDGTAAGQIVSEEKERKRLEAILKQSEQIWKRCITENEEKGDLMVGEERRSTGCKRQNRLQHDESGEGKNKESENQDGMLSLLSPELREQFSGMVTDNLLILPSSKSKSKAKKAPSLPPLTPQEIKAAKAQYKNTQRKLQQLEQRKKQKELRKGLYKQLEENALIPSGPVESSCGDSGAETTISSLQNTSEATKTQRRINATEAHSLLLKSSELGKKLTKKELLKQLKRKEELGVKLTKEEMGLLYVKREVQPDDSFTMENGTNNHFSLNQVDVNESAKDGIDFLQGGSRKKTKEIKRKRSKIDENAVVTKIGDDVNKNGNLDVPEEKDRLSLKKSRRSAAHDVAREDFESGLGNECPAAVVDASKCDCEDSEAVNIQANLPFAQLMFASLSKLKAKTDSQNVELTNKRERRKQEEVEEAIRLEEEQRKKRDVYIPSDPVKVSTIHRLGGGDESPNPKSSGNDRRMPLVQHINRPVEIEKSRYDLPVSAMEYEIIDAIRSHDCTIICSETGSGKSTQVPQFLYEAGFSTPGWWKQLNGEDVSKGESQSLLIGITQPRRVAAVSTAKRVCYEMGQGDGQSIRSSSGEGNIVSYQTRYESAGLGPSNRVKFMTDGILLQEIQSDLLLRKYGAIVIDEAHERNLNTDVLLGLLSVTLPLRQKAAEEKSLPPLKLVVMSATLRVEDFTENKRLFPHRPPAVVMVPGRTHPVSIHHSKVTELDDYEKVALDKVCKIHRKLPAGGILVFLTGKQEIVRMVNRLNHRFKGKREGQSMPRRAHYNSSVSKDIDGSMANDRFDGIRDMDDEELDGDLFQNGGDGEEVDDFEIMENEDAIPNVETLDHDDKRPKKVRILPLYSMLSAEEQAKVFAPVPDDERLIVIATNIAETSITIPGISYVVDSGRQKCRNYNAGTGVASYDIMWISKAAADQRAGRAGRTGPGHCYRLYSSSVYSRYLDDFALPEVLSRPLEDVVLAMKAMNVSNVASFPFPTPPDKSQISAAVRLLANIGCVDVSNIDKIGGDGKITMLGAAIAKLPLGVRYGKMLLVAAQAKVLDYAIVIVSVLSESSPFVFQSEDIEDDEKSQKGITKEDVVGLDEVDRNQVISKEKDRNKEMNISRWMHDGGDVLSTMMAAGAYAYASRGAGGASEKHACRRFCEDNGLNLVIMQRITKMRLHLCKLAKSRLPNAGGVAAESGNFLPAMPPPKRIQESLLRQAIASGLLDHIARRATPGILPEEFSGMSRSAYISRNSTIKEPLFIDKNSTLYSKRPEWVCFDAIVRKKRKDGTTLATIQRVTPIDPEWLAILCHGSNLLTFGSPLATPVPRYIREKDSIHCAVETKFGNHGWVIPPLYVDMYALLQNESKNNKQNSALMKGDSFRWFARYLLEGKVLSELKGLLPFLNDEPVIITRRKPSKKITLLLSALTDAGIDNAAALRKHWAEKDNKFLFKPLKLWVKRDCADEVKTVWISAVAKNIDLWRNRRLKITNPQAITKE